MSSDDQDQVPPRVCWVCSANVHEHRPVALESGTRPVCMLPLPLAVGGVPVNVNAREDARRCRACEATPNNYLFWRRNENARRARVSLHVLARRQRSADAVQDLVGPAPERRGHHRTRRRHPHKRKQKK
ncbi:hypothetical protein F444_07752 [Phytophthora nicotianae P1976]|nr:hypothetical protein F444_07752 [Phytophthora nicotianae P1976]